MGLFDDATAPYNAPPPGDGAFYAPPDGAALLKAIQASGGVVNPAYVQSRGSLFPISFMDDGTVRPDRESGIGPLFTAASNMAGGAATAPYEALKDVTSGNLQRDAYAAYGGGAPIGTQTESSAQDAQADVAGRLAAAAGSILSPSTLEAKPAGSLGAFGGGHTQMSLGSLFGDDVARESMMAAPQMAERATTLPKGNAEAAAVNENLPQYVRDLPQPTSQIDRAIKGTVGMTKDELLSSEPLWGYSATNAAENGTPHHVEFADLANQLFAAHGHNSYMAPQTARQFMAAEKAKYGMSPF